MESVARSNPTQNLIIASFSPGLIADLSCDLFDVPWSSLRAPPRSPRLTLLTQTGDAVPPDLIHLTATI